MQLATEPLSEFEQTLQDEIDRQEDLTEARIHGANNDYEIPEVEEVKDIYSLQPVEFIEMYKQLSIEEKQHLYEITKDIFDIRQIQTARRAELNEWCIERNIALSSYETIFKRQQKPKKMQNMMDATYVYFGKELESGLQRELFDK